MILFRADGNGNIGSGHVMRCLSLADAAGERGIPCCFVTAGAEFRDIIQGRGHRCIVLGTDYSDMESELGTLVAVLDNERPEAVVVDSYHVTRNYLNALKKYGRLAYVDDLAAFTCPVDVLINYNISAPGMGYEELYAGGGKPLLLLGPRYTPLRREFQDLAFRDPSAIKNVLVSTGGADVEHVALRLLRHLRGAGGRRYTFHFLLGSMNPDKEEIERLAREMPNIVIHENVRRVRDLMCSCDAALSASGSTLYELCACGLPIITYILADNQIAVAKEFAARGLALLAGDVRTADNLCAALLDLLDGLAGDLELRRAMAKKAYQVVDGKGAGRVIDALIGTAQKRDAVR